MWKTKYTSYLSKLCLLLVCSTLFIPHSTHAEGSSDCAETNTSLFSVLSAATWGNNPTEAQTQTEQAIQNTICAPVPRIKIPGLSFSSAEDISKNIYTDQNTGETFIFIPFLGEYIASIYRYGIALAGILIVIILIISGIQWILGGADSENISAAKERIRNAIIGLVLLVSSFSVLYVINPELTTFKSLKIKIAQKEIVENAPDSAEMTFNIMGGSSSTTILSNGTTITRPSWSEPEQFNCANPPPAAGVLPEENVTTYRCDGCDGSITTVPEMKEPMCRACALAKQNNLEIKIISSYRPYQDQVRLWCNSSYSNLRERRRYVSLPGYSNHGNGYAVDISLMTADGESLTGGANSRTQCSVNEQYARILFQIMMAADQGFVRYKEEIWHFELAPESSSRIRTFAWPDRCTE